MASEWSSVSAFFRARQRHMRSGVCSQQLLPGIANEITLDKITPKLSWIDLYTLSLVSPAWWEANRNRQVYNARVRSHSTETLAVLNYSPEQDVSALALFSTDAFRACDKDLWELPPIPGFERGIPRWCECVTLDGKVYILGGGLDSICEDGKGKVFVMDLARQTGWKRCASMVEARQGFGSCVKDGKIYVFGGMFGSIPIEGSEVYDPNEDKWSPIAPIPKFRYLHNVELMGDKFVLHSGKFWETKLFWGSVQISSPRQLKFDAYGKWENHADEMEFYDAVKDEWGLVSPFRKLTSNEAIFIYQDKVHVLCGYYFSVYHGGLHNDSDGVQKRGCSFASMGEPAPLYFYPSAALPLNDHLLATVDLCVLDEDGTQITENYLVLGKGFETSKEEISMEVALEFEGWCHTKQFITSIEL